MRGFLFCLSILLAVLQPTATFAAPAKQSSIVNTPLVASSHLHNQNSNDYVFIQHEYFEVTDDDDSDHTERKAVSVSKTSMDAGFNLDYSAFTSFAKTYKPGTSFTLPLALFILLNVFRI